jgi:hypothetical protein
LPQRLIQIGPRQIKAAPNASKPLQRRCRMNTRWLFVVLGFGAFCLPAGAADWPG